MLHKIASSVDWRKVRRENSCFLEAIYNYCAGVRRADKIMNLFASLYPLSTIPVRPYSLRWMCIKIHSSLPSPKFSKDLFHLKLHQLLTRTFPHRWYQFKWLVNFVWWRSTRFALRYVPFPTPSVAPLGGRRLSALDNRAVSCGNGGKRSQTRRSIARFQGTIFNELCEIESGSSCQPKLHCPTLLDSSVDGFENEKSVLDEMGIQKSTHKTRLFKGRDFWGSDTTTQRWAWLAVGLSLVKLMMDSELTKTNRRELIKVMAKKHASRPTRRAMKHLNTSVDGW